jgi:ABC-2 type transport system ATP-binding protein
MRRRLDVAAALVARPPVLFLDEPTTGLDPQSRLSLWDVIETLVSEGGTVLLTTQYLEEADRLANQIVVVDHGQVIAQGTSAELKATLGTTVVSVTFASSEVARQAAELLRGVGAKEASVEGSIVELTVDEGPKIAAEVLRRLDQHGVPVAGLALREPSLDDVFLDLTGHRAEDADSDEGGDAAAGRRGGSRKGGREPAAAGRGQ